MGSFRNRFRRWICWRLSIAFWRSARRAAAFCAAVLALVPAACDWQPEGTLIFETPGKTEFDRAEIHYPPGAGFRAPLRLKWVDTNKFMTSEKLSGKYTFVGRTYEGFFLRQAIVISEHQKKYVISQQPQSGSNQSGAPAAGAQTLKAVLGYRKTPQPKEVVVIFLGSDVTVQHVSVAGDRIETAAPAPGKYRVEIHELGAAVRSFAREDVDLTKPADLGIIELKGST